MSASTLAGVCGWPLLLASVMAVGLLPPRNMAEWLMIGVALLLALLLVGYSVL